MKPFLNELVFLLDKMLTISFIQFLNGHFQFVVNEVSLIYKWRLRLSMVDCHNQAPILS